ncbi:MAG: histidinol dehydrogenase [Firmicutes bacterium]|nr:histidinol dehydrogenase [Bacillota bacterium]
MLPIKNYIDAKKWLKEQGLKQFNSDTVTQTVKEIIFNVRQNKDAALFAYTKQFDGCDINAQNIRLTQEEIINAVKQVPSNILAAMRRAKDNIITYHKRQLPKNDFTADMQTGFIYRPVTRAGIYVPGGKAAYPSSVLMCALPAVVAGVQEIVMVTPPGKYLNPLTIAAAYECGVHEIYRVGGAQAIAALAYGTESIKRVDVITGPGNIYVTTAKKEVYGSVGIDMLAGPSEILIVADNSANPEYVAADLLGQAEHDELAQSILLTTDKQLALKVNDELIKCLEKSPRKEIARVSLKNNGAIVLCENLEQTAELCNLIAPEHLEICVTEYEKLLKKVVNAGAVFLGNYSPESLGDYYAGTNHVLPTGGTARFSSGLGVDTYVKRIGIVNYSSRELKAAANDIILLAETEELFAHAESIKVRIKK